MGTGALEHATQAGLRFLLSNQSETGYWSDWDLPVGESRVWTTAYVGYRLAASSLPVPDLAQQALRSASGWLAHSEFPEGGWGYNQEVGPDADSTALAILFLSSQGVPVALRSYERLRAFQQENGGFATYTCEQSFGAWTVSHPDVTALAIPALMTRYERSEPFLAKADGYVSRQVTPEGLWRSYWWNTPLYTTEAHLRWITNRPPQTTRARDNLLRIRPNGAFDTALLVFCLLHLGFTPQNPPVAELIGSLLCAQFPDGSWPSEAILRLPSRNCYEPWAAPGSGSLFADQHRIFTSATVTAALSSCAYSKCGR